MMVRNPHRDGGPLAEMPPPLANRPGSGTFPNRDWKPESPADSRTRGPPGGTPRLREGKKVWTSHGGSDGWRGRRRGCSSRCCSRRAPGTGAAPEAARSIAPYRPGERAEPPTTRRPPTRPCSRQLQELQNELHDLRGQVKDLKQKQQDAEDQKKAEDDKKNEEANPGPKLFPGADRGDKLFGNDPRSGTAAASGIGTGFAGPQSHFGPKGSWCGGPVGDSYPLKWSLCL